MKTLSGTIIDSHKNGVERKIRIYARESGLLIAETTSSRTDGRWTISIDYEKEVQVILLDDNDGTFENDQITRTTP